MLFELLWLFVVVSSGAVVDVDVVDAVIAVVDVDAEGDIAMKASNKAARPVFDTSFAKNTGCLCNSKQSACAAQALSADTRVVCTIDNREETQSLSANHDDSVGH